MRHQVEWIVVGCDGHYDAERLTGVPALAGFRASVGIKGDDFASIPSDLVRTEFQGVDATRRFFAGLRDGLAGLPNDKKRKFLLASFDRSRRSFQNSSAFVTSKFTGDLGAAICTTNQKLQIVRSEPGMTNIVPGTNFGDRSNILTLPRSSRIRAGTLAWGTKARQSVVANLIWDRENL